VPLNQPVEHRGDFALAGDVDGHHVGPRTRGDEVVDDETRPRFVDVRDDDVVAVGREVVDDRLAEPRRTAGDERDRPELMIVIGTRPGRRRTG
jgi:hypothetical protein